MNKATTSRLEVKAKPVAAGDPEREADYKNFHIWVTRHIRVIKGGSATLQECYLSYEGVIKKELGGILTSKKGFGQLLRDQLVPERKTGTV
jgi:hypothetical protein